MTSADIRKAMYKSVEMNISSNMFLKLENGHYIFTIVDGIHGIDIVVELVDTREGLEITNYKSMNAAEDCTILLGQSGTTFVFGISGITSGKLYCEIKHGYIEEFFPSVGDEEDGRAFLVCIDGVYKMLANTSLVAYTTLSKPCGEGIAEGTWVASQVNTTKILNSRNGTLKLDGKYAAEMCGSSNKVGMNPRDGVYIESANDLPVSIKSAGDVKITPAKNIYLNGITVLGGNVNYESADYIPLTISAKNVNFNQNYANALKFVSNNGISFSINDDTTETEYISIGSCYSGQKDMINAYKDVSLSSDKTLYTDNLKATSNHALNIGAYDNTTLKSITGNIAFNSAKKVLSNNLHIRDTAVDYDSYLSYGSLFSIYDTSSTPTEHLSEIEVIPASKSSANKTRIRVNPNNIEIDTTGTSWKSISVTSDFSKFSNRVIYCPVSMMGIAENDKIKINGNIYTVTKVVNSEDTIKLTGNMGAKISFTATKTVSYKGEITYTGSVENTTGFGYGDKEISIVEGTLSKHNTTIPSTDQYFLPERRTASYYGWKSIDNEVTISYKDITKLKLTLDRDFTDATITSIQIIDTDKDNITFLTLNGNFDYSGVLSASKISARDIAGYSITSTTSITCKTIDCKTINNIPFKTNTLYHSIFIGHGRRYDNPLVSASYEDIVTGKSNYTVIIGEENYPEGTQESSVIIGGGNKCINKAIMIGTGSTANCEGDIIIGNGVKTYDDDSRGPQIAIGYGMNTYNAVATIGNSTDYAYYKKGDTGWTVKSDRRDKTNILAIPNSLDFINKLTPVTYAMNNRENYRNKDGSFDEIGYKEGTHKEKSRSCGLIAQDVRKALEEVYFTSKYANVVDYTRDDNPDAKEDQYTMSYTSLIPFLIGAVKELSAKVDEQAKIIETLKTNYEKNK